MESHILSKIREKENKTQNWVETAEKRLKTVLKGIPRPSLSHVSKFGQLMKSARADLKSQLPR